MIQEEKRSFFTARQVLRVLSLVCLIVVFCPMFLVSCSEQTMNVSVVSAVSGTKAYGEYLINPHPELLICFLLPAAILVILFIRNIAETVVALVTAVCGIIDLVVWIIFAVAVQNAAKESYCEFRVTGWYIVNLILLVFIILISILVLARLLQLDGDLSVFMQNRNSPVPDKRIPTQWKPPINSGPPIGHNGIDTINRTAVQPRFCIKCGHQMDADSRFCPACGAQAPGKR